jgi:hypothetical protein
MRRILIVTTMLFLLLFVTLSFTEVRNSSPEFPLRSGAEPVLKVISISPCELKPADAYFASLPWYGRANEFYFHTGLNNPMDAYAYAPVHLPQGAKVTKLIIYYVDNACGVSQYLVVTLTRHNLATGAVQKMGEVTSDKVPCEAYRRTLEDATISNSMIDNEKYSYAFYTKFFDAIDRLKFTGAKIYYE